MAEIRSPASFSAASLLVDEQKKHSDSHHQGKHKTEDERNNPMPTGLASFDRAPFFAAPIPNQKRRLPIAVSAVIGAALWRPHYAYDYGELAYSASAKSPNPDQGYLARRRRER